MKAKWIIRFIGFKVWELLKVFGIMVVALLGAAIGVGLLELIFKLLGVYVFPVILFVLFLYTFYLFYGNPVQWLKDNWEKAKLE